MEPLPFSLVVCHGQPYANINVENKGIKTFNTEL